MKNDVMLALVRHILTILAGAFLMKYHVDGQTTEAITGGLTALVGVALSVHDKKKRH